MTKEQQFIKDAAAFIRFMFAEGEDYNGIVATLAHDIGGLERNDKCFLPRVSGYAEAEWKEQELKAAHRRLNDAEELYPPTHPEIQKRKEAIQLLKEEASRE